MTKAEGKARLKERVRLYRLRKASRSAFTQEQLEEIHELLETKRFHLSGEIVRLSNGLKAEIRVEQGASPSGNNHLADINYLDPSVKEGHLGKLRKLLTKIDEAIERLDQGVFGICENCEGPIAPQMLLASPVATCCCEECKREKERKQGRNLPARNSRGTSRRYFSTPAFA